MTPVKILQRLNKDTKKILDYSEDSKTLDTVEDKEEQLQLIVEAVSNLNIAYGNLLMHFYPSEAVVEDCKLFDEYGMFLEEIERDYAIRDVSMLSKLFYKCKRLYKKIFCGKK